MRLGNADTPPLVRASTRHFSTQPLAFLLEQHQRHGDVLALRLRGVPTVIFGGTTGPPALFRAERCHMEVHNTPLVHDLFGQAVFNLRGEEHRQARQILRAGLSASALETYAPAVAEVARLHVQRWTDGGFDLYQAARALTLDMCAEVILGLHGNGLAFPPMFDAFVRATDVISWRRHASAVYWRGRRARGDLRAMLVGRMSAAPRTSSADVLSHMMAHFDRQGLDPVSVPDHLLALMIATRETTASLITWLLVELALHPEIRRTFCLESRALLADPARLTVREIAPALRAALSETERLHSPNAISSRIVVADVVIGRYVIPTGWHAVYSPAANHLMPQLFDDPMRFHPERFLGRVGHLGANSLLTFGAGIHACPGKHLAEMMTLAVAAAVGANHRLSLPRGVPSGRRYLPVKAPTAPIHAVLSVEASRE